MVFISALFILAQTSNQSGQTLLESALSAYNDGLYEVAISQLEDFLELYPGSPYRQQALYYLARSYFELGDYEKAEDYFRKLLSLYSSGEEVAQAIYYLGVIEYSRGDIRKATARLRQVVNEFPDSKVAEDAYFLLAKIFRDKSLKEPEWTSQAISYYRRFLEKYPSSKYRGKALSDLSELLYMSGDLGEAENYAVEAYKAGEKAKALSVLSRVYVRLGKKEDALSSLQELSSIKGADEIFVSTLLEVFKELPSSSAIALLKEASEKDTPLSIKASMELASLYADSGENEQALVVIDKVLLSLDKYPISNREEVKAQLLLLKGKVLLAMGRVSEAEGVAYNLEGDGRHVILGYVHLKKGDVDKAVEEFSKVQKGALREAAIIGAATALFKKGEKEKALSLLSQIPLPPRGGEEIAVSAASLYYSAGSYNKVIEILKTFNSDRALSLKGWASLAMGDYGKALKYFSMLRDECESSFGMAMVYYNQKDYKKAKTLFEKVSSMGCKWSSSALYWEGWCYYKEQNYSMAIDLWRRLQKHYPSSDLADDAQFYIAQAFYTSGDLEAALKATSEFLKNYPESSYTGDVLLLKGESLVGLGRYDEAIGVLKQALEEHGKKDAVVYLADAYFNEGKLSEAESMLLDYIRSENKDPNKVLSALNRLGEIYTSSDYLSSHSVEETSRKLSSLYDSSARRFPSQQCLFWYNCAVFLHRMGALDRAALYYSKVSSLKCDYSRDAKRFLAAIYVQQKKCDRAASLYKDLLSSLKPEENNLLPEILVSLADCGKLSLVSRYVDRLDRDSSVYHYLKGRLFEKKDPHRALQEYRKALSYMDFWSQRAQFQRGALLYSMKKYREAGGEFAKVFYNWKDSSLAPAALYWSALSYKIAGEISLAKKVLSALFKNFPDSEYAAKAKKDFADILK